MAAHAEFRQLALLICSYAEATHQNPHHLRILLRKGAGPLVRADSGKKREKPPAAIVQIQEWWQGIMPLRTHTHIFQEPAIPNAKDHKPKQEAEESHPISGQGAKLEEFKPECGSVFIFLFFLSSLAGFKGKPKGRPSLC